MLAPFSQLKLPLMIPKAQQTGDDHLPLPSRKQNCYTPTKILPVMLTVHLKKHIFEPRLTFTLAKKP